jgi:hypothetical protein
MGRHTNTWDVWCQPDWLAKAMDHLDVIVGNYIDQTIPQDKPKGKLSQFSIKPHLNEFEDD